MAIARRLAADGWIVLAFDRDPSIGDAAAEFGGIAVEGDVRTQAELDSAVQAAEAIAPVAALVNNAAIVDVPRRGFAEIPEEEWDAVMAVNVGGVWKGTKAAVPAMRRNGSGSIVNIGSDTMLSGVAGLSHYTASKGAVFALTRTLASELGADGIRVNTIALGFTETESALSHPGDAAARSVQRRALARTQLPDDVVGTVAWLLSSDAQFVTGQLIAVNGGYIYH